MRYILHPATPADSPNCSVKNIGDCTNPSRYVVDASQFDRAATIIEVGSIHGDWIESNVITLCGKHLARMLHNDPGSSFRVTPNRAWLESHSRKV